jgi:hypothetical protein
MALIIVYIQATLCTHTNEHEACIVFIEKDLQETKKDDFFHPRRTDWFEAPELPICPTCFYSDIVYHQEDGSTIVGIRGMDQPLNTTVVQATITSEG